MENSKNFRKAKGEKKEISGESSVVRLEWIVNKISLGLLGI